MTHDIVAPTWRTTFRFVFVAFAVAMLVAAGMGGFAGPADARAPMLAAGASPDVAPILGTVPGDNAKGTSKSLRLAQTTGATISRPFNNAVGPMDPGGMAPAPSFAPSTPSPNTPTVGTSPASSSSMGAATATMGGASSRSMGSASTFSGGSFSNWSSNSTGSREDKCEACQDRCKTQKCKNSCWQKYCR